MDWTEVKIIVNTADLGAAEAIAQMTVPYGIYIEDYSDMLELVPQIAHIDLIDEQLLARSRTTGIIHIYISPDANPTEAIAFLQERLASAGIAYQVETAAVKEEEWSTAWRAYYHPTHIGRRLVVCPTWEEYLPAEEEVVLRLDPGMAFGTGTHDTTRLCCELLEQNTAPGCRVLDMGTGSGILSIAALKLGAAKAVGVDIDPVAVRTAKENAALNGFLSDRFTPVSGDLVRDSRLAEQIGAGYDIVCANIVADVIIALLPAVYRHLRDGGLLIASGIIAPRAQEVRAALTSHGFQIEENCETEGWCALTARKG